MYQTSGPDIQIYKSFIGLPWGMKPLCASRDRGAAVAGGCAAEERGR